MPRRRTHQAGTETRHYDGLCRGQPRLLQRTQAGTETRHYGCKEAFVRSVIARTKAYIVLLLAALVIVVWALVLGSRPVSGDKMAVRAVIIEGSSARDIATALHERGLIRSPFVFLVTCVMSGSSEKLKPGVYELSRAMSAPEVIRSLVEGKTLESRVTIPEGKTLREIADILRTNQLADPEAFLVLTTSRGDTFPSYSFVYSANLEGYLFPDTYLIKRGEGADEIVRLMLDTFHKKVVEPNRTEIEQVIARRFGLSEDDFALGLHKLLTVASLIEREAKTPADRPKISAVIWNRLAIGMKLDIDATVSYVLGSSRENKQGLSYADLDGDSPYNTYTHAGLPPAPICNPGLASIKAALIPASIDSLYYVARPDGSHVFSETLDQHNSAKQAIKDGRL